MKKFLGLIPFSLICLFVFPQTTHAVPPPDFLFNLGSSMAQVFSVGIIFLGAIFSILYKFIKIKLQLIKSKKILFIGISITGMILISLGSAYLYGGYKQKTEYNKWLEESQKYAVLPEEQEAYLKEKLLREDPDAKEEQTQEKNEKLLREYEVDKLKIGETSDKKEEIKKQDGPFVSKIDKKLDDKNTKFITEYYKNIATGEYQKAYDSSKKAVNYETFKGWYINTNKITIDNLVRIDEATSSLELTLYEGNKYTRYGVLMALKLKDENPIQVASSEVRILSEGTITEEKEKPIISESMQETPPQQMPPEETIPENKDDFFTQNENYNLSITNSEFSEITNSNRDDYIVIDARENLEYENGYFPGSTHIRFADLQAGKWIELPTDKYIFVLCWSGIRGKEVAEFLRTKDIVASYLENGANGWVEWGGTWIGDIKFSEQYSEEKYKKIFSTSEVEDEVSNGTFLVDCREPWKFENWHIEGSINIPIMYTPTIDLADVFAQVPANSTVITICDDYVNCFDAKITAVELEERGHTFIGRYNKPWEYE